MGKVIGVVTLSRSVEELSGGRYLVVAPESGDSIRHGAAPTSDPVVIYDELSPGLGARVAFSEGREAAMPFHPRPVPIDAYGAAILDAVRMM